MVVDLNSLRIPNVYLKVLAIPTCFFLLIDGLGPLFTLINCFLVLVLAVFLDIGMGDVKLLALSFIIFNSQMDFSILVYLTILFVCAFAHLLFHGLIVRDIPERIALAPSIFLAFALYFAAG